MTGDWIEMHLPRVYRFAVYLIRDHHAAEDIAQEAMLRAWRQRDQRRTDAITAWLLRITANLCHDYRRRGQHPVSRAEPLVVEPAWQAEEPWETLMHSEQQLQLQQLIDTLPDRERTVLYLSTIEQLSHAEIADVLGLSAGATKVALSRARSTLRDKILLRQKQQQHKL